MNDNIYKKYKIKTYRYYEHNSWHKLCIQYNNQNGESDFEYCMPLSTVFFLDGFSHFELRNGEKVDIASIATHVRENREVWAVLADMKVFQANKKISKDSNTEPKSKFEFLDI